MNFLKQVDYIGYGTAKLSKFQNQHAGFLSFLLTEDSLKNLKGHGTSFQITFS